MSFISPSETGLVNLLLHASLYPAIVGSLNLENADNNMRWYLAPGIFSERLELMVLP